MPVSFKREGGEIQIEPGTPISEETIQDFLYVAVKCKTEKGNYIDFIFDGAQKTGFSLQQTVDEYRELEVGFGFPEETRDIESEFSAELSFKFNTLIFRYMREGD